MYICIDIHVKLRMYNYKDMSIHVYICIHAHAYLLPAEATASQVGAYASPVRREGKPVARSAAATCLLPAVGHSGF